MDRMASGILLLAFGVVLVAWWYHTERAKRELIFTRMAEGQL
jgi:cbb3-type cytochrome oxidase subunit 3